MSAAKPRVSPLRLLIAALLLLALLLSRCAAASDGRTLRLRDVLLQPCARLQAAVKGMGIDQVCASATASVFLPPHLLCFCCCSSSFSSSSFSSSSSSSSSWFQHVHLSLRFTKPPAV